jgi:hypothetical protein
MAFAYSEQIMKALHEKCLKEAAPCATCGKKPQLSEDLMLDEIRLQCQDHHGVRTSVRKNVGANHAKAFENMETLLTALVDCWNTDMKEAKNGKK